MTKVIDFIVNDAAFKLSKGMVITPEDNFDVFIDTTVLKFRILSFIIFKTRNITEDYAYDYKPGDDTISYFIKLSLTDYKEISAIEQRIINKIKGIEVSSAPDLSTMGVERVS